MSYAAWSVIAGEQPTAAKWNILGTNDASFNDGTGIADSAILPKALLTGTGSSWAWQSWTPTLTNLSGGTLNYSKYLQIGKIVTARFKYTLAGAGVSGVPGISLPVTINSDYALNNDPAILIGQLNDATGSRWFPLAIFGTTSRVDLYYLNTTPVLSTISATAPFTWAVSDQLMFTVSYEVA